MCLPFASLLFLFFTITLTGFVLGVNLRGIVPKTVIKLTDLSGKTVAIDAYNTLYQFLSIIRQADGTPLTDSTGKVTSHLSGLLYRTSNLVELGIKPIFVFDGKPPVLKAMEIQRRQQVKIEARVHYEKAIAKGDTVKARKFAQVTTSMKTYMKEDAKRLLDLMGLPWVQAPSEGEAQAAHMTQRGASDYCGSQDYDSLLFGTPMLLRNITVSGRRKLPSKNIYIDVVPEVFVLDKVLRECEITYEQLIDIGILIGTDFNPDGIKGLGPKTALKLIQKHGNIENALPHIRNAEFPHPPEEIREIFLHPEVCSDYKLEWKNPDVEGIVDFLVREKAFSENRVRKAIEKMQEGNKEMKSKTTLEKWFG
jgi:flap endonuclease-1